MTMRPRAIAVCFGVTALTLAVTSVAYACTETRGYMKVSANGVPGGSGLSAATGTNTDTNHVTPFACVTSGFQYHLGDPVFVEVHKGGSDASIPAAYRCSTAPTTTQFPIEGEWFITYVSATTATGVPDDCMITLVGNGQVGVLAPFAIAPTGDGVAEVVLPWTVAGNKGLCVTGYSGAPGVDPARGTNGVILGTPYVNQVTVTMI